MADISRRKAACSLRNTRAVDCIARGRSDKDEFLATLAHELRTPLAPIRPVRGDIANRRASEAQKRRETRCDRRQVRQSGRWRSARELLDGRASRAACFN